MKQEPVVNFCLESITRIENLIKIFSDSEKKDNREIHKLYLKRRNYNFFIKDAELKISENELTKKEIKEKKAEIRETKNEIKEKLDPVIKELKKDIIRKQSEVEHYQKQIKYYNDWINELMEDENKKEKDRYNSLADWENR